MGNELRLLFGWTSAENCFREANSALSSETTYLYDDAQKLVGVKSGDKVQVRYQYDDTTFCIELAHNVTQELSLRITELRGGRHPLLVVRRRNSTAEMCSKSQIGSFPMWLVSRIRS